VRRECCETGGFRAKFAANDGRRRRDHGRAMPVRLACLFAAAAWVVAVAQPPGRLSGQRQPDWTPEIPRVWDEAALSEWATPLAGLNVRPTHMTPAAYYALPEENLRTYPVYLPGREPQGYADMLGSVGPKPLIEPDGLKTKEDWIRAGERVFRDSVVLRTFDPAIIAMARDPRALNVVPLPDGTVNTLRWVPTARGVALGFANCSACHTLYLPPGNVPVPGASSFASTGFRNGLGGRIRAAERTLAGEAPFTMGGPIGAWLYQAYGAPWADDADGERLKAMTEADLQQYVAANLRGGAVARWNGSILYPAKVPDLIGIQERKYIDHTGTHLHRGIGDLMRYAALVSFADATDFGPYRMLAPDSRRFQTRLPDAALYAMALYLYSLEPPPNPNPRDERAAAGGTIFQREGCASCHTPPLFTSNKLTLASGFSPPKDAPASLDVLPISVGTDPGLALRTRKGTGYYKVPSLRGVWYRGYYLHDGAAASLEELFDPDRLQDTHAPGGWRPPGVERRAIPGHEFGLRLSATERAQLIAYLRTL
jgi:mono/diheme cytochrome c family protein